MSSAPLESAVERKAAKFAEGRGWWQTKLQRTSKRGVPDRVFVRDRRVVWIEFKRAGEEPGLQQQIRIAELAAHGAEVYVCDSYEHAASILA